MKMESEHIEASKLLESVSLTLSRVVSSGGEDISYYSASILDIPIMDLIKARSLMYVMDSEARKE